MLNIGVFSPVINHCGGAEWVSINFIDALKKQGHKIFLLTNQPLNNVKIKKLFNKKILVDKQFVFPFHFFNSGNYHNIYTDSLLCLFLKHKCDLVIDPYSNTLLPGVDIAYIHYPLLRLVRESLPYFRNFLFFSPYRSYLNYLKKKKKIPAVFSNSKFSSIVLKKEYDITSQVLYPPVSTDLFENFKTHLTSERENLVITIGRISKEKNLMTIPYIASKTHKRIKFLIVGLLDSEYVLNSVNRLIQKLGLSERVKILTNITNEELKKLLLLSKVYLHTKIGEHFGISIVEAMASGCIPVVHDSGGPREFVPKYQRFNTIEDAAEKINKSIDTWNLKRAQQFSNDSEKFSSDAFSRNFIDLFNHITSSDKSNQFNKKLVYH